jgi:hypothetical protein
MSLMANWECLPRILNCLCRPFSSCELGFDFILTLSSSAHHAVIIKRLHDGFLASPFASVAARHRLRSLQDGHVSRGGLMDKLVWGSIRNTTLGGIAGDALRAVIVDGGKLGSTCRQLTRFQHPRRLTLRSRMPSLDCRLLACTRRSFLLVRSS